MARDTKTFQQYLDTVQRLCGIDTLSTDETEFFTVFFDRNLQFIWQQYDWPFICPVESRTPDGNDVIEWAQATETVIGEVLECWKDDPFGNVVPRAVPYRLTGDGIQLFANSSYDPTYVWFRERLAASAGSPAFTFPYDFFQYVCHASYADWLASNDQTQNSAYQRGVAEQLMMDAIEIWSRQQRHTSLRSTIKTHGTEQLRS